MTETTYPVYYPIGATGIVAMLSKKETGPGNPPSFTLNMYACIPAEYNTAPDGWGVFTPLAKEAHAKVMAGIINAVYRSLHAKYDPSKSVNLFAGTNNPDVKPAIFNFLEHSLVITPDPLVKEETLIGDLKTAFSQAVEDRAAALNEIERGNKRRLGVIERA